MLRMARAEDKAELLLFWQDTFGDDARFVSWFFEERFFPQYTALLCEEGRIISCVHSKQQTLSVRGRELPCAVYSGVATRKGYEGQGRMHGVMRFYMNEMRKLGFAAAVCHESAAGTYRSLGHCQISDALHISLDSARGCDACESVDILSRARELHACYSAFASRYSGIARRTYENFLLKCRDYLSCGAKCAAVYESGALVGYGVYFETERELQGEECLALNAEAYEKLWAGLCARANGRMITARFAPNAPLSPAGAAVLLKPETVMGVVNAAALLGCTGLCGCAIEISDPVVAENNGVFDVSGKPSRERPAIKLTSGALAQWAVGYRSMEELIRAGDAVPIDTAAAAQLNALPKLPCFMFEQY